MKKSFVRFFIFLISIIAMSFFLFWIFWNLYDKNELKKEKSIAYSFSEKEKNRIKDGDIILRRGFGFVSDYIVNEFDEQYKISHCGIVCKSGECLTIIHSESSTYLSFEGIQVQSFEEYVEASHQNSVLIVRFNNCDTADLSKVSQRAKYYLSTKVPFDYRFDMTDSTEMYCAEIIWHIFKDEFNTDIYNFPNKKVNYSQFANFWDSTYFDVVINHQKKEKGKRE